MSTSTLSFSVGRQSFLVVFDFDHTVVDCNTDEVIPQHLGRGEYQRTLMESNHLTSWTYLVDEVIAPFTRAKLSDAAVKSVTMDKDMPSVFHFLLKQYEEGEATGETDNGCVPTVEVDIASDANILFIESSIEHHIPFVRHIISQIHSNSFYDVEGNDTSRNCRLEWYEPNGHNCYHCNTCNRPNMCKSRIIARLLQTTHLIDPTVIFVGDGANDLCPILNVLRPRDYMFARHDFPIHRLLTDPHATHGGGCCKIALWSNAGELLQLFQSAMSSSERLPTLVRFRDAGTEEFRSITLLRRMPQILTRTLKENEAYITETGRRLIHALIEGTRSNAEVPPLPGQEKLPSWLQSYARTREHDSDTPPTATITPPDEGAVARERCGDAGVSLSPRWGQLPWLYGEIYLYHLLAQYLMLADTDHPTRTNTNNNTHANINDREESTMGGSWVPNLVTPYTSSTPIVTRECTIAGSPALTATGIAPAQSFDPAFLAKSSDRTCVSDGVALSNGVGKYHTLMGGDFIVPHDGYFQQPYRDFFAREKHDVLHNFLQLKICPMLACVPWEASTDFLGVLLRWMLWGNGVDLSMFTLEELQDTHPLSETDTTKTHQASENDDACKITALRTAEAKTVAKQDDHIIGNQLDEVVQLVRRVVEGESTTTTTTTPYSIDIVMDNVGVECVADLIFALWLLRHHPTLCVVLHVKNMPYYVSDVTPPDIAYLVHQLEAYAAQEPTLAGPVITPFVQLIREALCNKRLRIDADAVWTQPCEYRELPPRVCNTFFFTRQLLTTRTMEVDKHKNGNKTGVNDFAAVLQENYHYTPRSALVLFKGDLNFRRLVGDRHWDNRAFLSTLTPEELHNPRLSESLLADTLSAQQQHQGEEGRGAGYSEAPSFQRIISAFWPVHAVPVCAIRTLKSEGSVGVTAAQQDKLDRTDPAWRTSGKYGVILLASGEK